ncbi:serine/threonine-protein phosphatase CPPED1 isoform X4 [Meles meles]|nr:serine/threonine-protein phosphatase CPPED1 isoform X4 [Meles meles]
MKAWSTGDSESGGDEWGQEIRLTEQAVEAINKLKPKPKFFVLCGDLIHAMPGMPWRKEQTADLQRVLARVDRDIPLVLVSGNHDVGNTPTPETVAEFQRTWGDDYFSFWVGGVLFLVLNSQFWYDASRCPALKQAQDQWLDQQLSVAGRRHCQHAVVFQHIPLFLHSIDEEDDYFNLTKSVRKEVANKLTRAVARGSGLPPVGAHAAHRHPQTHREREPTALTGRPLGGHPPPAHQGPGLVSGMRQPPPRQAQDGLLRTPRTGLCLGKRAQPTDGSPPPGGPVTDWSEPGTLPSAPAAECLPTGRAAWEAKR